MDRDDIPVFYTTIEKGFRELRDLLLCVVLLLAALVYKAYT